MPTILISGAANGLGAAFVEAYQNQQDARIIAIDRSAIRMSHANVEAVEVDVTSNASINGLLRRLEGQSIDTVIHCAGIRGLVPSIEQEKPDDVPACETLQVMDAATLTRAFQVNVTGTFLLLRALLPNLKMALDPKAVVMASRMGSIGNNQLPNKDSGSAYAYRASKAATNMIVRSFAVDVPDITFVLCHPGRVETSLVRCKEEGAITAQESVDQIMELIPRWNKEDSGRFYDRFGSVIEW